MSTTRKRNYYQLLGVPRDATVEQIKESYRDIARLYHPDSNFYDEIIDAPADESGVFKDDGRVYRPNQREKRKEYDQNLAPEIADWDSGDAADDVRNVHHAEMTERERRSKETAERVKRDLVGKGKVFSAATRSLWWTGPGPSLNSTRSSRKNSGSLPDRGLVWRIRRGPWLATIRIDTVVAPGLESLRQFHGDSGIFLGYGGIIRTERLSGNLS